MVIQRRRIVGIVTDLARRVGPHANKDKGTIKRFLRDDPLYGVVEDSAYGFEAPSGFLAPGTVVEFMPDHGRAKNVRVYNG